MDLSWKVATSRHWDGPRVIFFFFWQTPRRRKVPDIYPFIYFQLPLTYIIRCLSRNLQILDVVDRRYLAQGEQKRSTRLN